MTSLQSTPWVSTADHCDWDGVICGVDWENKTESWYRVVEIRFNHTSWSGEYFDEIPDLRQLEVLRANGNSITGSVPDDLCSVSTSTDLYIVGDESNCPNTLVDDGCCDEVKLEIPSAFLSSIVADELGSADCDALSVSDNLVCQFMSNKNNHYLFQVDHLYPNRTDFPYVDWLKVS